MANWLISLVSGLAGVLMEEFGVKTMADVHAFVKMLTADTIQAALDAELEGDLGYSKYDYKNKSTDNSRNGYSKKTVQGSFGELEIDVPHDRNGEFEPQLVKKHQTDVSAIEDKVIFLYGCIESRKNLIQINLSFFRNI